MTNELKRLVEQLKEIVILQGDEELKLDYNSIYGGYRLDIVMPSNGFAERFLDSSSRISSREMVAYIKGYLKAKE